MVLKVGRRFGRALPLLAATIAVGVGTYFVGVSAIHNLQSAQAEFVASSFGKYLVQQVDGLPAIIDGSVTSGGAADTLATIRPIGSIFKFRIYDRDGNLKVDSSPFAAGHVVDSRNAFEDSDAQAVAASSRAHFTLNEGDGRVLPVYYAEAMVPLRYGNRVIGVISVLSDETEAWPDLFSQFRTVIGQILVLVVVAFGVPVVLYLRKLGQLEIARRRLRHSAHYDGLTGVLNRAGFAQMLTEELSGNRGDARVGVQIIDIDRFKDVNEAAGHAVGDELLRRITGRIVGRLGINEKLARLGADEFAILQPFTEPSAVARLAADIARTMAQPFLIDGRTIQVGASVGYARFPQDGETPEDVTRAADVALRHAKLHARGRAVAFDPSMEAERRTRHRIDTRLREALVDDGFDLHFQPVYDSQSRRLRGFEALLRLNDSDGRPIPPAEFIPVAEEVGLIGDIGRWVLRSACRVASQWPDDLFVAVNLSPAQFASASMAAEVRDVLAWSGIRPGRLELEVTESLLITDSDHVLSELKAIKAQGPSLALDDFGTGYSSLSYLWRFPFDKLKVDRSFMADLTEPQSKSREILSTIIALGKVLNLEITAEGVETEAQAAVLRELHCDLVQGYLLGRPQRTIDVAATIIRGVAAEALSSSDIRKAAG